MKNLIVSSLLSVALVSAASADDMRDRSRQALDSALEASRAGPVRAMPDIKTPAATRSVDVQKIAEQYRRMEASKTAEGLLIFVSHSMPKAALMRLARDAKRARAVLVFRGIKGNLSSQGWLKSMEAMRPLTDTGAAVQIHPDLFKEFGVKSVPTFVLTQSGKNTCDTASACKDTLVAVGDASLGFVLDRWSDAGGALGKMARDRLDLMGGAR